MTQNCLARYYRAYTALTSGIEGNDETSMGRARLRQVTGIYCITKMLTLPDYSFLGTRQGQRRDIALHRISIDNYDNYDYGNYRNFRSLEACMAKSVVTQERVFEVAAALTDRGEEPGILSVQAAIGGGSYSTVKRYLDVWKETGRQRRAQITLPDAAVERLMSLGRDFWALLEERTAREVDQIRAGAKEEAAALAVQVHQAEQAIAKLEHDKEQIEQLAAEREAANQALQAEIHVQRERATAAESKATQLEARIVDLKAELDRALKQAEAERQAAAGARKEAQAAALEGAVLKGELAALRGSKT